MQLVNLETIRPSDLAALNAVPGGLPTRNMTKLDKRPRALFVTGHSVYDVEDFRQALAVSLVQFNHLVFVQHVVVPLLVLLHALAAGSALADLRMSTASLRLRLLLGDPRLFGHKLTATSSSSYARLEAQGLILWLPT